MSEPEEAPPRGRLGPIEWLLPALAAAVLCIPLLGFGYLWDDYAFLNDADRLSPRDFSPFRDPANPFWRPISRQLYFAFLHGVGSGGPIVGHALNLLFLAIDVFLLARLVSRALDRRHGLLAGCVFASLGVVPFLVGWISGIQDLLAVFFVLLAILFRSDGKHVAAVAAAAGALLCKETAAAFLPVIACVPWIEGKAARPRGGDVALYALLAIAWASVHPGIRGLLTHRFAGQPDVYVGGVRPGGAAEQLGRLLLALLNLPQPDAPITISTRLLPFLLAAFAILLPAARLFQAPPDGEAGAETPWPARRMLIAGGTMAIAPILLTSLVVRVWQPYYAAIGGIGLSIVAAPILARRRPAVVGAVLAVFLVLGGCVRSQPLGLERTTEQSFRVTSSALETVRRGFLALRDRFPEDSRILVSTQVRGVPGVYTHLYEYQALRQWYRLPTLQVAKPEMRRTRPRPEFLFLVTDDLNVYELNPMRFAYFPQTKPLVYSAGEQAFRAYALGLYASNDVRDAVLMLLRIPEVNAPLANAHRRLAAGLLLAAGHGAEADSVLAPLDSLPRAYALENVAVFLAEPLPGADLDRPVLQAFGFRADDRDAWLTLARWCALNGYAESGLGYVAELRRLDPRDPALARLTEELTRTRANQRRLPTQDDPAPGRGP